MLNIKSLSLGGYETNCYIVYAPDRDGCVVIDPGYEPEKILDALDDLNLTPAAIFLTHGHFDHVGAVDALAARTGCQIWISECDWSQPKNSKSMQLFPLANCICLTTNFYEHMEKVTVAGLTFTIHHTPGHTRGSVCLECENALFTGDTLFAGSCGRTDLPGGDPSAMAESLRYLSTMKPNYEIYPGHGGSTCLDAEKRYNPYLKGLL